MTSPYMWMMDTLWLIVFSCFLVELSEGQECTHTTFPAIVSFCQNRTNSENHTVDFTYKITDRFSSCSDTNSGTCKWRAAYIHNDLEACIALRLGIMVEIDRYRVGLKKPGGFSDCSARSFAGVAFDISSDADAACVALDFTVSEVDLTGNVNASWINLQCNAPSKFLCELESSNSTTTTTPAYEGDSGTFAGACLGQRNTVTSHVVSHTTASPTSETTTGGTEEQTATTITTGHTTGSAIMPCVKNENDTKGLEEQLASNSVDEEKLEPIITSIVFGTKFSCKAEFKGAILRTAHLDAREHNETNLVIELDRYSLQSAKFPAGSGNNVVLAMVEPTIDLENAYRLIETRERFHSGNERKSKIFPGTGKVFHFIAYDENGTIVETPELRFSYNLEGDMTILQFAENLTYHMGNTHAMADSYRIREINPLCVSLNRTEMAFVESCQCVRQGKSVQCISYHNSVFAVLFSVTAVNVPSGVKVTAIITEFISAVFLVVTFAVLVRVRKKVRGERIPVQINLVVSLAFLHFWSLLHDVAIQSPGFCIATAFMIHFFLISSGAWMSIEAFLLYLKTSHYAMIKIKRKKLVVRSMAVGWGIPSVICLLTLAIGIPTDRYMQRSVLSNTLEEDYGSDRSEHVLHQIPYYDICWLSAKSGIRWAAILPIIIVLILNTAIACKVGCFVYYKSEEAAKFRPTQRKRSNSVVSDQFVSTLRAALKAVGLLVPILGIPWIFMFCSNTTNPTVSLGFMYFNAIINGLQGFFVFLVYVVVGKEVRVATMKTLSSFTTNWQTHSESSETRKKRKSAGDISGSPRSSVNVVQTNDTVRTSVAANRNSRVE